MSDLLRSKAEIFCSEIEAEINKIFVKKASLYKFILYKLTLHYFNEMHCGF